MTEYIEREAVLREAERDILLRLVVPAEKIQRIRAADVAPVVHGRWIAQDETFTRFMCSHCKSKNHCGGDNYCPNCGAKMDVTNINVGNKEGG